MVILRKKLTISIFLLILTALAVASFLIILILQNSETAEARKNLHGIIKLVDAELPHSGGDGRYSELDMMTGRLREAFHMPSLQLSVIGRDGDMLYDSSATGDREGNQKGKKEITEALKSGIGDDVRSPTPGEDNVFYVAARSRGGDIVRASVLQSAVDDRVLSLIAPILLAALVSALICTFLIVRVAKDFVRPYFTLQSSFKKLSLTNMDLEMPENEYEEVKPILRDFKRLTDSLSEGIQQLNRDNAKIAHMLDNMDEGFIILDQFENILILNKRAREYFGITQDAVGVNIITCVECVDVLDAISRAISGEGSRVFDSRDSSFGGRTLRFHISAVSEGDNASATVLISDVTDLLSAERIRSEFTANVSHELKTPLTSIKGFMEMLTKDPSITEESRAQFFSMINVEVERLIALINDILIVSELENSGAEDTVSCDAAATARESLRLLEAQAKMAGVRLSLDDEDFRARISEANLKAMIINLVENSIKYNRENGEVNVSVKRRDKGFFVRVADTGIGIPPEHIDRVFERFYRVDKSRSKKTGGTGLGLAIVKHIAQLYAGEISTKSTPGEGTEIEIFFPGR